MRRFSVNGHVPQIVRRVTKNLWKLSIHGKCSHQKIRYEKDFGKGLELYLLEKAIIN